MKAELILQSDVLDIVFENKNKSYGAYELRKQYRRRLFKSVSITIAVVILFASLMSWKIPRKKGGIAFLPDDVTLHEYAIKKVEPKTTEPKKQPSPQHPEQKQFTAPIIIKTDSTNVPDQKSLDKSVISTINKAGSEAGIDDVTPPPSETSGNGNAVAAKEIKEEEVIPIYDAQVMPQYPGGIDALKKFIQRNTQQPDDLEEGQRFVVDANGNITHIAIEQKGRKDLDMEVMKVIKKMPQWIPGKQNGRSVPVYFRLPITFMPQE